MKILDVLKKREDYIGGNGVSDEEIKKAEETLGLTFATDYKEYLKTIGLAMYDGHELTGLGCADRVNVVCVTENYRNYFKDVPSNRYVVEDAGIDNIVIWQNSEGFIYQNNEMIYDKLVDYLDAKN